MAAKEEVESVEVEVTAEEEMTGPALTVGLETIGKSISAILKIFP